LLGACSSEAPPAESQPVAEDGAALYAQYCALCHGDRGQGYAADNANALAHPQFLATATDELLRRAIVRGRPGTPMSAWGKEAGGPLNAAEVEAVLKHLRSWQTTPAEDVGAIQVSGVASRGEVFYEARCQGCHGERGKGGEFMSLTNPEFLASASDGFLKRAIEQGREGTPMPAFGAQLTPQTIDDLVVLLRSWQLPPGEAPGEVPPWKDEQLLLNPQGPDPAFDDTERFVGVDRVWESLTVRKERMVLLDARAPSDYALEHIAGAVSGPFYDVASFADRLPRDTWIVAYCGCPHAASGAAVDALIARGFQKVRVLDEGFYVWRERGYSTRVGVDPLAAVLKSVAVSIWPGTREERR
jgi:cytochrome c oxidase cbb3-type subunit 3/ubiquinol-cytochrome c reductase cytochrome c subunit